MECEGCKIAKAEAIRQTGITPVERDIKKSDYIDGRAPSGVFLCFHNDTDNIRLKYPNIGIYDGRPRVVFQNIRFKVKNSTSFVGVGRAFDTTI